MICHFRSLPTFTSVEMLSELATIKQRQFFLAFPICSFSEFSLCVNSFLEIRKSVLVVLVFSSAEGKNIMQYFYSFVFYILSLVGGNPQHCFFLSLSQAEDCCVFMININSIRDAFLWSYCGWKKKRWNNFSPAAIQKLFAKQRFLVS